MGSIGLPTKTLKLALDSLALQCLLSNRICQKTYFWWQIFFLTLQLKVGKTRRKKTSYTYRFYGFRHAKKNGQDFAFFLEFLFQILTFAINRKNNNNVDGDSFKLHNIVVDKFKTNYINI